MKKTILILPLFVVIVFIFYIDGQRFTALSAAESHDFLSKDAELVEKYEIGSSAIFLFKSDGEKMYRTVLSEKSGMFFRSSVSTYFPYSSDELQTVASASFMTEKEEATLLSVISYDEKVAYIEAGLETNIVRKQIEPGERVTFLFPFIEQLNFLEPTAFNKEGEKLYYYGYPKDTNIHRVEDIRWHKIN